MGDLSRADKEKLIQVADGLYVERDVLGVIASIAEYDPNLKVKVLAGDSGDPNAPPYRLVEVCRDGIERIVFDIWELDARVLERIKIADNARNQVLETVEKANERARLNLNRRYREQMDEAHDIVKTFLKSRTKSKWTVRDGDRLVTIEDR